MLAWLTNVALRMWALLGGLHVVAARTGMLLGARYVKVNRSM